MVEAITAKMDELGISYEDLMKTTDGQPMLKPVEQKQIERVVIESD